jgi:hypothetical protein
MQPSEMTGKMTLASRADEFAHATLTVRAESEYF